VIWPRNDCTQTDTLTAAPVRRIGRVLARVFSAALVGGSAPIGSSSDASMNTTAATNTTLSDARTQELWEILQRPRSMASCNALRGAAVAAQAAGRYEGRSDSPSRPPARGEPRFVLANLRQSSTPVYALYWWPRRHGGSAQEENCFTPLAPAVHENVTESMSIQADDRTAFIRTP
jgi:hypothetical protein